MDAEARHLALSLSLLFVLFRLSFSDDASDAATLLKFKDSVADPSGSLDGWTQNSGPCREPKWAGIICNGDGEVYGLQLENMGLSGPLNLGPLTDLPSIRTLSFSNNRFTGPMPGVRDFKGLKNVYLSANNFTGGIRDDAFDGMRSLKKVVLSRNKFSGRIPSSLVLVNSLSELWVDYNGFDGQIPNFQQSDLQVVNVSNNNLEGSIPPRLSAMDPSMFAGGEAK
ncbi:uncharacterized protein A4U43_C05F11030 [Asparagus officinalis]|uniref:Leucine-rich repeat-containing N-terminal plant-type domain-containing protein n=1 Tax=Asparagus officinalis TaxID=4686 RepID=A0A5P1EQV0_ASPOF|nr:uncharacterized protein A4U43_C05F11030 [Asparagus officinalis]